MGRAEPEQMSPTFDPASAFDDDLPGAVLRRASLDDVDAILDLWRRAHPGERRPDREHVERLTQFGWFLILDHAAQGLIAAVHVRIQGRIGRVSMLTIDPRHRRHQLATRMLGIADALCAVFGCTPYEELATDVAA